MKTGEATASPVLFLQSDSQGFVHGCEREGRKEGRKEELTLLAGGWTKDLMPRRASGGKGG